MEKKGLFHSSDRELNQIWEACRWTQQCCSLDAFVDTPWREQAQWWGDARVQARNMIFLTGDVRLFRRGIDQIAGQVTPNGLTYGHSPTMAHNCVVPDFTLTWIITLWDYYWQTGSLEPFLKNIKPVENALSYFEGQLDEDRGLLPYDPRYYLFLETNFVFKRGFSAAYNLLFLITLKKLAFLYSKAAQNAEAARLDTLSVRLKASLDDLMSDDGLMHDGYTFEGDVVKSCSVHVQTLVLSSGLWPEASKDLLAKRLVPFICGEEKFDPEPSAFWLTNVFEALIAKGYGQEVLKFIRERWRPMAEYGTTWENFEAVPGNLSCSHAWSAHPLFHLFQILGGVTQTAAKWKRIRVAPSFWGKSFKGALPTPQGLIKVAWRRRANQIVFQLNLPADIRADIDLPGIRRKGAIGDLEFSFDDAGNDRPQRSRVQGGAL